MYEMTKRLLSLLLAVVLFVGVLPVSVLAAELDSGSGSIIQEVTATDPPTETGFTAEPTQVETQQLLLTEPLEEITTEPAVTTPVTLSVTVPSVEETAAATVALEDIEETAPGDPAVDAVPEPSDAVFYSIAAAAVDADNTAKTSVGGSISSKMVGGQYGGAKFSFTFDGVFYKDKNSINTYAIKTEDGWKVAYCIEPGKKMSTGTTYNGVGGSIDEVADNTAAPLSDLQAEAIGLALLYGQQDMATSSMSAAEKREQISYQMATQMVVHEIMLGWREARDPYSRVKVDYYNAFNNTSGKLDVTYTLSVYDGTGRISGWQTYYEQIVENMAKHFDIPSFTGLNKSSPSAQTIILKPDGTGKYVATVEDKNGILSEYTFPKVDGLTFAVNGNVLTITADASFSGAKTVAPTKNVPSLEASTFYVWTGYKNGKPLQKMLCAEPKNDPVPAYFKVKISTGDVEILKETNTGANLSGWSIDLWRITQEGSWAGNKYIGTNIIPEGSDSVTFTGLEPGWYRLREKTDSGDLYWDCNTGYEYEDDAGRFIDFEVRAGEKATIVVHNDHYGKLLIQKRTSTGKDLGNWKFGVYTNAACTEAAKDKSGKAIVLSSANDGVATTYLLPGTYWVKEISSLNGWVNTTEPQKVVVVAGKETEPVVFINIRHGSLVIQKYVNGEIWNNWYAEFVAKNESISFRVWSEELDFDKTVSIDLETGIAKLDHLLPGRYYIQEVGIPENYRWVCDTAIKEIEVVGGSTATHKHNNDFLGDLWIKKTTEDGRNLQGWHFVVRDNAGSIVAEGDTDAQGYLKIQNGFRPGVYTVEEIVPEDSDYICGSPNPQSVTVLPNKTAEVRFHNVLRTTGIMVQKVISNVDIEQLEGWEFTAFEDEACTKALATGFTDAQGVVSFTEQDGLRPGKSYWIKETGDKYGRDRSEFWTMCEIAHPVTAVEGELAAVTCENAAYGKLLIQKTTNTGAYLGGWWFDVYADSDCKKLVTQIRTTTAIEEENGGGPYGAVYGEATVLIPAGTYWIKENTGKTVSSDYWKFSNEVIKVDIVVGETSDAAVFHNEITGRAKVQKIVTNGTDPADKEGWIYGLYFDEECNDPVVDNDGNPVTVTTDEEGKAVFCDLSHGKTYWIKEIGDTHGRFRSDGWEPCVKAHAVTAMQNRTATVECENYNPAKLRVIKNTNTGNYRGGWEFGVFSDESCAEEYFVTTAKSATMAEAKADPSLVYGELVLDLPAGTYWVKELPPASNQNGTSYWIYDDHVEKVVLEYGACKSVTFTNNYCGAAAVQKVVKVNAEYAASHPDENHLKGWKYNIYSSEELSDESLVASAVTDDAGKVVFAGLENGKTYWIKEIGDTLGRDLTGWTIDTEPISVTAIAGITQGYESTNIGPSWVHIRKETTDGTYLGHWYFCIYSDPGLTDLVATVRSTSKTEEQNGGGPYGAVYGEAVATLKPGTYWVQEKQDQPVANGYWSISTEIQKVEIAPFETASISFYNALNGHIKIVKTTEDGRNLQGWQFDIYDHAGNFVMSVTTGEDGTVETDNLHPGIYTVEEIIPEGCPYVPEKNPQIVTVKSNAVTEVQFHNRFAVEVIVKKIINNENTTTPDLAGWIYTAFSDEACTLAVDTATTNAEGIAVFQNLHPGVTYWIMETDDSMERDLTYWIVDDTAYEITPTLGGGEDENTIVSTNFYCGKFAIAKTTEDGQNLQGWQFEIRNAHGELCATVVTGEDGTVETDNLLPGEYTVTEIVPDGSLYAPENDEYTKNITVSIGETAEVQFHNRFALGQLSIQKVNIKGNYLAGAKFLLEWSEDGIVWTPVVSSETPGNGFCSNEGVTDGTLTTDETGIITWTGLPVHLVYRVTELEAPEGYQLLAGPAFEGTLQDNADFHVQLAVVNTSIITFPATGVKNISTTGTISTLLAGLSLGAAACLVADPAKLRIKLDLPHNK